MKVNIIILISIFSLIYSTDLIAQSSNQVTFDLETKYSSFQRIDYAPKELYYVSYMKFKGQLVQYDDDKQITFKPSEACTYKILSSYYDPNVGEYYDEQELIKIKEEHLNKTIVLQFK